MKNLTFVILLAGLILTIVSIEKIGNERRPLLPPDYTIPSSTTTKHLKEEATTIITITTPTTTTLSIKEAAPSTTKETPTTPSITTPTTSTILNKPMISLTTRDETGYEGYSFRLRDFHTVDNKELIKIQVKTPDGIIEERSFTNKTYVDHLVLEVTEKIDNNKILIQLTEDWQAPFGASQIMVGVGLLNRRFHGYNLSLYHRLPNALKITVTTPDGRILAPEIKVGEEKKVEDLIIGIVETIIPGGYSILYVKDINAPGWSDDKELTGQSIQSLYSDIRSDDGNVHVVWNELSKKQTKVMYARSQDNGLTWNPVQEIYVDHEDISFLPSIAISGDTVYIARIGLIGYNIQENVFLIKSEDAGISWGGDKQIIRIHQKYLSPPSIAADGNNVYLIWGDTRDSSIYFMKSANKGVTWSERIKVGDVEDALINPKIVVDDGIIRVATVDHYQVQYIHSSDGGLTWKDKIAISPESSTVVDFDLTASDNRIQVIWREITGIGNKLTHAESTDGGIHWTPPEKVLNLEGYNGLNPVIAGDEKSTYVVYSSNETGKNKLYFTYKKAGDWLEASVLTHGNNESIHPQLSLSNTTLWATWSDNREGDWRVYVKYLQLSYD